MAAEDRSEVAEFVVDLVGVGDGLGDGLADGLAPGLAEAVELGAQGGMGAAEFLGEFLQGGVAGIGEDPGRRAGRAARVPSVPDSTALKARLRMCWAQCRS